MSGRQKLITWRSGGWQLSLAVLLILLVAGWRMIPVLSTGGAAIGDGRNVESYRFDLGDFTLSRENLAASGLPRDGIPALDDPPSMAGAEVLEFNEQNRGRYLVSEDRVIGVVVGGEARAYPLRVLNWHEVVNDTLGGEPIAVTFHPLCESVAVFRRELEGEPLRFGVSGLLYNSNLLMFDRRESRAEESLWSQILGRAVSGPASLDRRRLSRIPASLARWDVWLGSYPDTTVLRPDPAKLKRYQRDPYGNYLRTGKLRFPVSPVVPPDSNPSKMARILVVEDSMERRILALGDRDHSTALPDAVRVLPGATPREPSSILVASDSTTIVTPMLWFAWFAHHPDSAQSELRGAEPR